MNKSIDTIALLTLPFLSGALCLFFDANLLVLTLFFFGLPALLLSVRQPTHIKKVLFFSLVTAIPVAIIIDYLCVADQSWYVFESVFPRLFGKVVVEDILWLVLMTYDICFLSEYFKQSHSQIHKHITRIAAIFGILLFLFLAFVFMSPETLQIPYAYLWIGLLFVVLPIILFLPQFPQFLKIFITISFLFIPTLLLAELTGLKLNLWEFSGGHLLGHVSLFGLSFPFEELIFFIILSISATLSYYEFFANNPHKD